MLDCPACVPLAEQSSTYACARTRSLTRAVSMHAGIPGCLLFNSISTMPEYSMKSAEELRAEDYRVRVPAAVASLLSAFNMQWMGVGRQQGLSHSVKSQCLGAASLLLVSSAPWHAWPCCHAQIVHPTCPSPKLILLAQCRRGAKAMSLHPLPQRGSPSGAAPLVPPPASFPALRPAPPAPRWARAAALTALAAQPCIEMGNPLPVYFMAGAGRTLPDPLPAAPLPLGAQPPWILAVAVPPKPSAAAQPKLVPKSRAPLAAASSATRCLERLPARRLLGRGQAAAQHRAAAGRSRGAAPLAALLPARRTRRQVSRHATAMTASKAPVSHPRNEALPLLGLWLGSSCRLKLLPDPP